MRAIKIISIFAMILMMGWTVSAKEKKGKKAEEEKKTEETEVAEPEPAPIVQENTLAECTDGVDNDGDSYVDCDDQDCEIYAVCVKPAEPEPEVEEVEEEEPPAPVWIPESGHQCRDGRDNNGDGLIDCHEVTCQRYRYCKQIMYEVPEPSDKAPGLMVNFGFGVAFPNFRTPTAEADYGYRKVPFDPDMGGITAFKLGYLPLKWLGFGANLMGGISAASNQYKFYMTRDDPDFYKYVGAKTFGHVGGFVRFQWPFDRIVPYLDLAAGYSFVDYRWDIYDPSTDWDDISGGWDDDDYDDDWYYDDYYYDDYSTNVEPDQVTTFKSRHFTFALEPGIDFYVSKRRFAIGMNAWLPVIASNDSSTDNVGVMFTLTYMPMWREAPQLKPEYDVAMAK